MKAVHPLFSLDQTRQKDFDPGQEGIGFFQGKKFAHGHGLLF